MTDEPITMADEEYFAMLPEQQKALAREFPLWGRISVKGVVYLVVGYSSADGLIVAPLTDGLLAKDAQGVADSCTALCAKHLRNGEAQYTPGKNPFLH